MASARTVLIVAAHPDDEVLGLGGQFAGLGSVQIVHVTDGAPRSAPDRDSYARQRRVELAGALALAGIELERTHQLHAVDQEASLEFQRLTAELARMIDKVAPDVVFTHPYEGGHPDHDACAFVVRRSVDRLGGGVRLREFTSYHNAAPEQPEPELRMGHFLPVEGSAEESVELDQYAIDLKRRMLNCFTSQRAMVGLFPLNRERVRDTPRYDFTQPPHAGRLFYETQNWGLTGAQWRELARAVP